jgi:hypothetical protein
MAFIWASCGVWDCKLRIAFKFRHHLFPEGLFAISSRNSKQTKKD